MIKRFASLVLWLLAVVPAFAIDQASAPTPFNIPWANSAGSAYTRVIPQASQIGIQSCAASLTDGFPPLTFIPSTAGGCPPFGQDFNGILKQITQWSQWQAAGAPTLYSSAFSGAIGGYPKGTVLANASTVGCWWLSIVDNNGSNPDASGSNWLGFCSGGGPVGYNAALSTANSGYPKGTLLLNSGLNSFWLSTVNSNTTNPDAAGAGWVNLFNATLAQFWGGTAGVATTNNWTVSIANWTAAQVGIPIHFIAPATNTGAATLNVNGLGAVPITRPSVTGPIALVGNEMLVNQVQTIIPDGAGNYQLVTHASTILKNEFFLTASQTYSPSAGLASVEVTIVAGGGAGGGAPTTSSSQLAGGGGGGAGGQCTGVFTPAQVSGGVTLTIGAGGLGSAPSQGAAGGNSSFGSLLIATGAQGGSVGSVGGSLQTPGGPGGDCSTGTVKLHGSPGGAATGVFVSGVTYFVAPGYGAPGYSGAGGGQQQSGGGANGISGTACGSGGSGANGTPGTPGNLKGGDGFAGCAIIREFVYN